jgi:hypothetical protein
LIIHVGRFYVGLYPPEPLFNINDINLMHPVVPPVIPNIVAGMLGYIVPLVVLFIVEVLFFWDVWDAYHLLAGFVQSASKCAHFCVKTFDDSTCELA